MRYAFDCAHQPIPDWPGYFADVAGNIWSKRTGRWILMKPRLDRKGYPRVGLSLGKRSRQRQFHVHKLILLTFIGPRPEGLECRHLNGNRTDNRLENLCWGTARQNYEDRVRHGTDDNINRRQKTHCPKGHAYDAANTYIYAGTRRCRACHAALTLRRYHERRAS